MAYYTAYYNFQYTVNVIINHDIVVYWSYIIKECHKCNFISISILFLFLFLLLWLEHNSSLYGKDAVSTPQKHH